jgi:ATP-dependent Clp protease, protease subunit
MSYFPYVIEKTANGERAMDLPSRLLKERIVFLNGEVNDQVSASICAQLLFLESEDPKADISFYINSPGGVITSGLAIYDTMAFIKPDVSTIVMGQSASMGSFLAMAGAKGKRMILPHATHLIHQPLGGARGQASDIEIQAREIVRLKTLMTELYSKHTGQQVDKLRADMDRDFIMTATEAVAYGLADRVVYQR